MRTHFTELAVRQLKPSTTPYWDKTVPGFGIRVGKFTRTWVVMRGRSRERTVIGRYPDLTLSDASREAKQLLLITPGPKIDSVSFEEAKRQFLDQNYRERSVRAKREATRRLTKHFST